VGDVKEEGGARKIALDVLGEMHGDAGLAGGFLG
jgi:hypothetical protein